MCGIDQRWPTLTGQLSRELVALVLHQRSGHDYPWQHHRSACVRGSWRSACFVTALHTAPAGHTAALSAQRASGKDHIVTSYVARTSLPYTYMVMYCACCSAVFFLDWLEGRAAGPWYATIVLWPSLVTIRYRSRFRMRSVVHSALYITASPHPTIHHALWPFACLRALARVKPAIPPDRAQWDSRLLIRERWCRRTHCREDRDCGR